MPCCSMISCLYMYTWHNKFSMQGVLRHLEGISLAGFQAELLNFEAFGHMAELRILILDRVKTDSMLPGCHIPRLAMLSWRSAGGRSLPIALQAVTSAAVLYISENCELERLPADWQASTSSLRVHSNRGTFSSLCDVASCLAFQPVIDVAWLHLRTLLALFRGQTCMYACR